MSAPVVARQRLRRVVALALLTALAATACSKTEKDAAPGDKAGDASATTTSTEPTTRTTRGITDTSIKVGGILWAGQFGGIEVGAQARFDRANAEGGVHGRKIEFVGAQDDGNDAGANLAAAQKLVRQDKVFAILPMQSNAIGALDFLVEENVPFFGWGVNPAYCHNEVGFGFTGCVSDPELKRGSNAMGTALKELFDGDTDKSIAIIAEDNDSGKGGIVLLQNSLEALGFEVPYAEAAVPAPPAAVGDFTPFVNAVLTSDAGGPPDLLMMSLSTSNALGLSEALQGRYDGMAITPFYDPRLVGNAALQGQLVLTQILPYEWADETPALQQMLDDVAAYDEAHGTESLHTLALAAGYWAADMFVKVLEETGEDLTVERFLATANGGDFEYEAGGVIGPSKWPQNHDFPVPCASLSKVEGNEYVRAVKLVCGENFEL